MLWRKFALHIGVHGLTNIYKRAGIQYRFARPQARKYLTPGTAEYSTEVIEIRRQAADDLLNILASGKPLIFVDECSIQSQQGKMRTWMQETRDVLLPQSSVSCSTTVYVGIGNIHAGPHFMLGRSTNSADFRRFLEELRWARTDNMDADYFLILDGKLYLSLARPCEIFLTALTPLISFRSNIPPMQRE